MMRSFYKQANPELAAMWAVGQRIWQRDFPGVYTAIAAFQWSENILPVMESLRGTTSTTAEHFLVIGHLSLFFKYKCGNLNLPCFMNKVKFIIIQHNIYLDIVSQ